MIKELLNKIDWTYITALFSITFGWFLNEFGQWLRTRQDDKKIKKQILYNLLETNFIFNQLNTSELVELVTSRVLLRIPKNQQTEETKQHLIQQNSDIVKEFIQGNVADNLEEIEEKYSNAVDSLSTIDPITAYRLKGKTKILQTLNLLQSYYENVKKQFPNDSEQIQKAMEITTNTIEPDIIKTAISDIEEEIRNISFSINTLTWYKTKRTLKLSKKRIREDSIQKIDTLFDKLMPNNE